MSSNNQPPSDDQTRAQQNIVSGPQSSVQDESDQQLCLPETSQSVQPVASSPSYNPEDVRFSPQYSPPTEGTSQADQPVASSPSYNPEDVGFSPQYSPPTEGTSQVDQPVAHSPSYNPMNIDYSPRYSPVTEVTSQADQPDPLNIDYSPQYAPASENNVGCVPQYSPATEDGSQANQPLEYSLRHQSGDQNFESPTAQGGESNEDGHNAIDDVGNKSDDSERIAVDSQYSTDKDSTSGSPRRDAGDYILHLKKKYGVAEQQQCAQETVEGGSEGCSLAAPSNPRRPMSQGAWDEPNAPGPGPGPQRLATVNLSEEASRAPQSFSSFDYVKGEKPDTMEKLVREQRPPIVPAPPPRRAIDSLELARQFAHDLGLPTDNLRTQQSGSSGWASEPLDISSDQQHSFGTYPKQNAAKLMHKLKLKRGANLDEGAGPSNRPPLKTAEKRHREEHKTNEEEAEDGDASDDKEADETGAEPGQKRPRRDD